MNRVFFSLVLLFPAIILCSCASPEKIKTLESETMSLGSNYQFLSDRVDGLEARIEELHKQMSGISKKLVVLTSETRRLEGEKAGLESGLETMAHGDQPMEENAGEEELEEDAFIGEEAEGPFEDSPKPEIEEEAALRIVEIKVLSGSGSLAPAAEVSGSLDRLGYEVSLIDRATKPFKETTVFHAPEYLSDAIKIADAINGTIKPLTWDSRFDIIVVVAE
jgi:regulator of replication initiation timing